MSPFSPSPFLHSIETPRRTPPQVGSVTRQVSCADALAIHFAEPWWRSARSLVAFSSGTLAAREAMHDSGQVVYNDSTTRFTRKPVKLVGYRLDREGVQR